MNKQATIIPAFAVAPAIAAKHEREIARAMHRANKATPMQRDMTVEERREAIIEAISNAPGGIAAADIKRAVGAPMESINNDFKALKADGFIRADAQRRWHIVKNASAIPARVSRTTLERRARLEAIEQMLRISRMSAAQVAARLGSSEYAAREWLNVLRAEGRADFTADETSKPKSKRIWRATAAPHSAKSRGPASGAQEGRV